MERSRIARRFAAAAFAFQAGLALTLWGAAGVKAGPAASCDGVTGRLVDHGTTVTGVFDVPATCEEVSVLSWFAAGPHGEQPQVFLDRAGHDNVAAGHYEWTIAAPPPECFRQLDLRVPGRNVDSIVGGTHKCSSSVSTTTSPSTTTPRSPSTTSPSTTIAPPVSTTAPPVSTSISPTTLKPPVSTTMAPTTTVATSTTMPPTTTSPTTTPPRGPTTTAPTTTAPTTTIPPSVSPSSLSPSSSTTSTALVAGLVLTPPAPQGQLASTGRSLAEMVGVALIGLGLGLGVLTAQKWQRQTRAD